MEFPFALYDDNDPYSAVTPAYSPYVGQMPTLAYWEKVLSTPIRRPEVIQPQFKLYSNEDPFYNEMPAYSPYIEDMPSARYWENYQKMEKAIKTQSERRVTKPPKVTIGMQILMNLGGRENPKFMASIEQPQAVKDLVDGSGIGFVLDDKIKKLMPKIRRNERFVPHQQSVKIIECQQYEKPLDSDLMTFGDFASDLGHSTFCEQELIETLFQKKELFKTISEDKFESARKKSNQYEKIGKAIFMNRAAVKMANIDALFNLTNSDIFGIPTTSQIGKNEPFYFADICAGPGGFTEYLYWRLGPRAQGFGMTLYGDHDWAPNSKFNTDVSNFVRCYGADSTGNIFLPKNIMEFYDVISTRTRGKMVSLVTADGGVAVDGEENNQESLLKRLVLCQFLCALEILQQGGNFVCKIFDCFTDFMSTLLYLTAQCFEKFSIVKPYTSRPANSERYAVFIGLRQVSPPACTILAEANKMFKQIEKENASRSKRENGADGIKQDIMALFPVSEIPAYFGKYLKESNEDLLKKQMEGVDEFLCYAYDPKMEPLDQDDIAQRCLSEWKVPRNRIEAEQMKRKEMELQAQTIAMQKIEEQREREREYESKEIEQLEADDDTSQLSFLGKIISKYVVDRPEQMECSGRLLFKHPKQNHPKTFFSFS